MTNIVSKISGGFTKVYRMDTKKGNGTKWNKLTQKKNGGNTPAKQEANRREAGEKAYK